jgi:hypothetical protein
MGVTLENNVEKNVWIMCMLYKSNYTKYLMCYNKNGMNITEEFLTCMFKYKEKDEFENIF